MWLGWLNFMLVYLIREYLRGPIVVWLITRISTPINTLNRQCSSGLTAIAQVCIT
jgi:acetyl-CoA acetyltransferase